MRYAKGLREEAAQAIVRERARGPFPSIDHLARRVPELRKSELVMLAEIGALNWVGEHLYGAPASREAGGPQCVGEHLYGAPANGEAGGPQGSSPTCHRRDALWQVERAARSAGPLLE